MRGILRGWGEGGGGGRRVGGWTATACRVEDDNSRTFMFGGDSRTKTLWLCKGLGAGSSKLLSTEPDSRASTLLWAETLFVVLPALENWFLVGILVVFVVYVV